MMLDKRKALLTGQYLKAAIYSQRHNRQLQLMPQHERTAAEVCHMPRESPAAFGEHHNRRSMLQGFTRLRLGLSYSFWTAFVHHDMASSFAGFSQKRDATQFFLHQPTEVVTQIAVYKEYIIWTLMVGDKHIAAFPIQLFSTDDLNLQKWYTAHQLTPQTCRPIGPKGGIAKRAPDYRDDGSDNCDNSQQRHAHQQLVDSIQEREHS